MRAKILATLREWNILIGFCFVLGGVIFHSLDLINAAGIGDGRADLSQFSAAGIPSCFQGFRAGGATEFTRCPGTGGLGEAKPTPGGVGAGGTPDARPRLSSTIERPRHLRHSGERSSGAAPCSLGVVRASGTPDAWPTTSATIERPRPVVVAANAPPAQPVTPTPPTPAGATAVDGDAATGRQVYRKCQACHSLEPGKNTLGPSLAGIIGKKSGEAPNYNYSAAMKAANLVWDAATLDAYLLDPQKLVPQNKMPFPGLKTANERKDVIAYLVAATSPAGAPAVAQRAQPPAAAPAQPSAPDGQRCSCLRTGCPLHFAFGHCRRTDGLSRRRRHHRRTGQSDPFGRGGTDGTDHPDQRRRGRARHRIPRAGCKIVTHFRPRRKHDHRVPRHARRRFHLPVQRSRS